MESIHARDVEEVVVLYKTALPDSPNWLNGSSEKVNANCWSTQTRTEPTQIEMQNFQKTSSLSLPTLLQDIMEKELHKIEESGKESDSETEGNTEQMDGDSVVDL